MPTGFCNSTGLCFHEHMSVTSGIVSVLQRCIAEPLTSGATFLLTLHKSHSGESSISTLVSSHRIFFISTLTAVVPILEALSLANSSK
jgi:hypothetical protein